MCAKKPTGERMSQEKFRKSEEERINDLAEQLRATLLNDTYCGYVLRTFPPKTWGIFGEMVWDNVARCQCYRLGCLFLTWVIGGGEEESMNFSAFAHLFHLDRMEASRLIPKAKKHFLELATMTIPEFIRAEAPKVA
jgi:hypothetical protein